MICDLSEEKDAKRWTELGWEAGEVARRCKEAQAQSSVSSHARYGNVAATDVNVGAGGQEKVQRVWKWNYGFVLASEEEVKELKAKQAKAAAK